MSLEITLIRDYYDTGCGIFTKNKVTLETGVTVLVGCNGAGKSTMLRQIKTFAKDNDIPCIKYDRLDEGRYGKDRALMSQNFSELAQLVCSSEGEETATVFARYAGVFGSYLKKHLIDKDYDKAIILIDAVDSGLSIDAIEDMKIGLFDTILEYDKNKEIYIVVSANAYEVARKENCLDVQHCKAITFNDYEEYRKFIVKSREIKDKRYEKEAEKSKNRETRGRRSKL